MGYFLEEGLHAGGAADAYTDHLRSVGLQDEVAIIITTSLHHPNVGLVSDVVLHYMH